VPIDWQRALERAEELKAQGYSDSQVSAVLDQEAEAAAANRRSLQEQRGHLNADAVSPAEQPAIDPIDDAFATAEQSGHQRGSDGRMRAYVERIFAAAAQGDERVMHQGVISEEVKQRWMGDAHRRQIFNRDKSEFRAR
jgi:hypothetical protein